MVAPLGLIAAGPIAAEVGAGRAPDGVPIVILRLETTSTSWCQPLSAEQAEGLAAALTTKAAEVRAMISVAAPGLIVPHEHSNGNHHD